MAKRRAMRAALWTERLVPVIAAPFALLAGFCALVLLTRLPPLLDLGLLILTPLAAAALLWRGLRRIEKPTGAQVDRRLERGDPHRPLLTLADRPALPGAEAVWQAHRERALTQAAALRPGVPRLGGATAWQLGAGVVAVLAGLIVAGPQAGGRLAAGFAPGIGGAAAKASLEAWIVPPRAAGLGPIFLHPQTREVAAPVGSVLTVSVQGGGRPHLDYAGRAARFHRLDAAHFQAELHLTASGVLNVRQGGRRLGQWRLAVAADAPPTIRIAGPARVAQGLLSLPWEARDDYGLARVTAEIRLVARPGAAPVEVGLPLSGLPRTARGAALPDLTANPWAGLAVLIRYVAHDSAGQRGASDDAASVLPERPFSNPVARALVAVRRGLAVDPDGLDDARHGIDHASELAAGRVTLGEWLELRAIAADAARTAPEVGEVQARLWRLALAIEDGGVKDAKQRLAAARDALRDALADQTTQPPEVKKLTEALQQAMRKYLDALQQQAARADEPPPQADGRSVDQNQLEQMAKQMQDAAKAGRMQEAQQRLQQLEDLLDRLRPGSRTAQNGQQAGQQGGQVQRNPALDRLLQDQQALQRDTDQRLAGAQQGGNAPPQEPRPQDDQKQESGAQEALRKRLGDLALQLGEQGGSIPDGLAQADRAMRDARERLQGGDDAGARGAQQRAIDGLRNGQAQLAQQQQQGNGKGQQAGNRPKPGTDPLGRALTEGGSSPDQTDANMAAEGDAARSRALRDEVRRRAADRTRPPSELEYLQRLLDY